MLSVRGTVQQKIDALLNHFIYDKTLYYYPEPDWIRDADMLLDAVRKNFDKLTAENDLAAMLKLNKMILRNKNHKFQWVREFLSSLNLVLMDYYRDTFGRKWHLIADRCNFLLNHEIFDEDSQIDLICADSDNFNFKWNTRALEELIKINKLNHHSCKTILNLHKFEDGKILRLIVNCIANEIEVSEENLVRIKKILTQLRKEVLFENESSEDDESEELILQYISAVLNIPVKNLDVMTAVMPVISRAIRNDSCLHFSSIDEESITTQMPFVIKILNDNQLLSKNILTCLYTDQDNNFIFDNKPEQMNNQYWRLLQGQQNDFKVNMIRKKLDDIITKKKILEMSVLLFFASQSEKSIFSFIPLDISFTVFAQYSLVLMGKRKMEVPVCTFFKASRKIVDLHQKNPDSEPANKCGW